MNVNSQQRDANIYRARNGGAAMDREFAQLVGRPNALPPKCGHGQLMGDTPLDVAAVYLKFNFYADTEFFLKPKGVEEAGTVDSRKTVQYEDKGKQVIKGNFVDVSSLDDALFLQGYGIVRVWITHKFDPDLRRNADRHTMRKKFSVNLLFEKDKVGTPNLLHPVRDLINMMWRECYVWRNPDCEFSRRETITINCRNPERQKRFPDTQILLEEGKDEKDQPVHRLAARNIRPEPEPHQKKQQ